MRNTMSEDETENEPTWCECGDSLRHCGTDPEGEAAAKEAGITDEKELWMTYYCFGCNQLYKLTRIKREVLDEDVE